MILHDIKRIAFLANESSNSITFDIYDNENIVLRSTNYNGDNAVSFYKQLEDNEVKQLIDELQCYLDLKKNPF